MQALRDPRILKGIMWVVLLITIPSFVLFYGFTGSGSAGTGGGIDRAVAKVNLPSGKRELMLSTMRGSQDGLANELLGLYAQEFRRPPDQRAISQVTNALSRREIAEYAVGELAFEQLADDYDIYVTNEQVTDALREAGVTNEQFNQMLARERMRPGDFLRQRARLMRIDRAKQILASAAHTTLPQMWSFYRLENTKATAEVVSIATTRFVDQINPTDEELMAYHEANKDKYRKGEERVYSYVLWAPPAMPLDPTITDLAAQAEYDQIDPTQDAQFAQAPGTEVRQIVRYDVADGGRAARATLEQLRARLAAGEDFAALANAYSEDINNVLFDENADAPGFRGGLLEERVSPANRDAWRETYGDAWATLVDTAAPGSDVSLVDVVGGVALVRVEARYTDGKKPLSEVRALVESRLRARRTQERTEQIKATVDLNEIAMRKAAEENTSLEGLARALELEAKVCSPTLTTQYSLPGVASLTAHAEVLDDLKKGEISPVLRLSGSENLVVVRIDDLIAERPQTFEEARVQLTREYKSEKSREMARDKANALAERVRSGDSFTSAAAALELTDLTPRTIAEPFSLGQPPPDLQNAMKFATEASNAKAGDVLVMDAGYGDFIMSVVVAKLNTLEQPDRAAFIEDSARFERGLGGLRADAYAQAFRDDFVKRTKVDYDADFVAESERSTRRRTRK